MKYEVKITEHDVGTETGVNIEPFCFSERAQMNKHINTIGAVDYEDAMESVLNWIEERLKPVAINERIIRTDSAVAIYNFSEDKEKIYQEFTIYAVELFEKGE